MMGDGHEHQFSFIKPTPKDETDLTAYHSIHTLRSHFSFELYILRLIDMTSRKHLTTVRACGAYLTYRPFRIESRGSNPEGRSMLAYLIRGAEPP